MRAVSAHSANALSAPIKCAPSLLAVAISAALFAPAFTSQVQAATFTVSEAEDNGLSDTPGTLSHAIAQANSSAFPHADFIELTTNVELSGPSQALIDSDITLIGQGHRISGGGQYRPLFIKSGRVHLQDLSIENGLAQGMSSDEGGSGAGLGGGLFIYDGDVSLLRVRFNNNRAIGGRRMERFLFGRQEGGGMQRSGAQSVFPVGDSGSSLFGDGAYGRSASQHASGNYGGFSGFSRRQGRSLDPVAAGFGGAGFNGGQSGFGAGGSFNESLPGHGGFGGGGAAGYYGTPGLGGFGAASGSNSYYTQQTEIGGFGTSTESWDNRDGAGLGGGLFVRSGQLRLSHVQLTGNRATSALHSDALLPTEIDEYLPQGFGGGIFLLHRLTNTNSNHQGMPTRLPAMHHCQLSFGEHSDANFASHNFEVIDPAASNGRPGAQAERAAQALNSAIGRQTANLFARSDQRHSMATGLTAAPGYTVHIDQRQSQNFVINPDGCHNAALSWRILEAPDSGSLTLIQSTDATSNTNARVLSYTPVSAEQQAAAHQQQALLEVRDDSSDQVVQLRLQLQIGAATASQTGSESAVEPVVEPAVEPAVEPVAEPENDPSQPEVNPPQPAEPTDPAEPTEPAEPPQPTEPTEPTEPAEPRVQTEPTQPTEPAQPNSAGDDKEESDNAVGLGSTTGLLSLLIAVLFHRRRNKSINRRVTRGSQL